MSVLKTKDKNGLTQPVAIIQRGSHSNDTIEYPSYDQEGHDRYNMPFHLSELQSTDDPCFTVYNDYTYNDMGVNWDDYNGPKKPYPSGYISLNVYQIPATSMQTGHTPDTTSNSSIWFDKESYTKFCEDQWSIISGARLQFENVMRDDELIRNQTGGQFDWYYGYDRADGTFKAASWANGAFYRDYPLCRQYLGNWVRKKSDNTSLNRYTNFHTADTTNGMISVESYKSDVGGSNNDDSENMFYVKWNTTTKVKFGIEYVFSGAGLDDYIYTLNGNKYEYNSEQGRMDFYGPYNWIGVVTKGIGRLGGYTTNSSGYMKMYDLKTQAKRIAKDTYYLRDDDYYTFTNNDHPGNGKAYISNQMLGYPDPYMYVRTGCGVKVWTVVRTPKDEHASNTDPYLAGISYNWDHDTDKMTIYSTGWAPHDWNSLSLSHGGHGEYDEASKVASTLSTITSGDYPNYNYEVQEAITSTSYTNFALWNGLDKQPIRVLARNYNFRPSN
jgi:hypothetical protein